MGKSEKTGKLRLHKRKFRKTRKYSKNIRKKRRRKKTRTKKGGMLGAFGKGLVLASALNPMRTAAYANMKPVNGQGPILGNMSYVEPPTTNDTATDVFENTSSGMVNYTAPINTSDYSGSNYLTTTNYLDQMPDYSTQISNSSAMNTVPDSFYNDSSVVPSSSVDFSHVDGMIEESTTPEQRNADDFCHDNGCEGTLGIPRPKMPQIDTSKDLTSFIEVMENNDYKVDLDGKVNFREDNIIPTQGEVRITRSKGICKLKPDEMMGVPIIVIKGKNKNHKEEIIILDGHHRSYAKKSCSMDPNENVIIVYSKSGKTAKETAESVIFDLEYNNSTPTDFFPGHAFGGRKTKKRRSRKGQKKTKKTKKTKQRK